MKKYYAACLFLFFLISCQQDQNTISDPTVLIPSNSDFIIQSNDLGNFINKIDSTAFFQKNITLLNSLPVEELKNISQHTASGKSSLLSFTKTKGKYQYLYITEYQDGFFNLDSIKNKTVETLTIEGETIKKYALDNLTTFTTIWEGNFVASNSQDLLVKSLKEKDTSAEDEYFLKALAAADKNKTSILINQSQIDQTLKNTFKNNAIPLSFENGWMSLDFDLNSKNIQLNGISISNDKAKNSLKLFENIIAQPNRIAEITPTSASGFYSFTYKNFDKFYVNLKNTRKDSLKLSENNLLNYTREAGVIFNQDENVFILTTSDPELAFDAISNSKNIISEYRDFSIYENEIDYSQFLSPLLKPMKLQYYAFIDEFVIFSENVQALENIIANYQNNSTLANQAYYKETVSNLAGSSTFLMVGNNSHFTDALKNVVNDDLLEDLSKVDLKDYPVVAVQFVQDANFTHVHAVMSNKANNTTTKTVNTVSANQPIQIDAKIATTPFLLKNHDSNKLEIAVQDEKNVLYLISQDGKVLWKKKMDGRILGEIQQVDLFKNGNLQMAFTTQNSFEILDRTGKTVKPFPTKFKDAITQPLSIFDYDNNRDYRFVITQNNQVFMLDSKARSVDGFDFDKTKSDIVLPPKHIRINRKDYILVSEENGLVHILSRQGKTRIPIKEKIKFGENQWYPENGNFVNVNEDGKIVSINEKGKVTRSSVENSVNLKLLVKDDIKVTLSENILKIGKNEINLDFGLYTKPQIFKANGRTLIAVTDTQAKKVFLFDKNGEMLPNFPVFGGAAIDLNNSGNSIEFTVKGDDDAVLLYKL